VIQNAEVSTTIGAMGLHRMGLQSHYALLIPEWVVLKVLVLVHVSIKKLANWPTAQDLK